MRVARIMKEIEIAILVGEARQSPSTTTDGEVQGEPHRLREYGGECRLRRIQKQWGDEGCRLNERCFYD